MRESCIAGTIIHNSWKRRGTTANWRMRSQSPRNRQLQKLHKYDSREKLAFASCCHEETIMFWVKLAYVLLSPFAFDFPYIYIYDSLLKLRYMRYDILYWIIILFNYLKHQLLCHISTDVQASPFGNLRMKRRSKYYSTPTRFGVTGKSKNEKHSKQMNSKWHQFDCTLRALNYWSSRSKRHTM